MTLIEISEAKKQAQFAIEDIIRNLEKDTQMQVEQIAIYKGDESIFLDVYIKLVL